jgi:hypothetical protein
MADRVKGHIKKNIPKVDCEFIVCDAQSFPPPQLQHFNQDFHNPFVASHEKGLVEGRTQGHLRGWAVYDYEFVRINRRWGMNGLHNIIRLTICYRGNQLGVAVRWKTGETEIVDTLQTFKSMYQH